jgi:hypothetical protein
MTPTPPNSSEEALREETEDFGGQGQRDLPATELTPGNPQDPQHDVPEPDEQGGDAEPEPVVPERVRTGTDRVDEVIRAVEELEDRPIEEHVGVFESAQVQLRRALDDPGDASEPGDPGDLAEADDHPGHG